MHCSSEYLNGRDDLAVELFKLRLKLIVQLLVLCILLCLHNHDAACGSLCCSSRPELFLGGHIHVGNIGLFTDDGDVRNHINWGDISSNNNESFGNVRSNSQEIQLQQLVYPLLPFRSPLTTSLTPRLMDLALEAARQFRLH